MNISWSLNVLILLTLERLAICAPSADHDKIKKIHFRQVMNMSIIFKCTNPQERSYYLAEMMEDMYQNTSESVDHPVCVVLRTCDKHAGCCSTDSMTCGPVPEAIYYEDMQVKIKNFVTRRTDYRWIRVEQHGSCECMERKNDGETRKRRVMFINGTSAVP